MCSGWTGGFLKPRRLDRFVSLRTVRGRPCDHFTVVTALREEVLRVSFLEVVASDFQARDVCGDGQDRNTTAIAVIESVDQMKISWAGATRTHSQLSRQMRFGARDKSGGLLMPHMNPAKVLAGTNRIRDAVEGVAGHSADSRRT